MTHPGAKLNFMGNEIGQQIEWRYYEAIEWFLAKDFDATHGAQQRFIEALNTCTRRSVAYGRTPTVSRASNGSMLTTRINPS